MCINLSTTSIFQNIEEFNIKSQRDLIYIIDYFVVFRIHPLQMLTLIKKKKSTSNHRVLNFVIKFNNKWIFFEKG